MEGVEKPQSATTHGLRQKHADNLGLISNSEDSLALAEEDLEMEDHSSENQNLSSSQGNDNLSSPSQQRLSRVPTPLSV